MVIPFLRLLGIIGNTQKKAVVHLGVVIILMTPIYVFILEVINSSFNLKGMANETGVPNQIIIVPSNFPYKTLAGSEVCSFPRRSDIE